MADANDVYDTIMRELSELVICDIDEVKDEQESFSSPQQADFDDTPPSLLSYFETSKSRAAVCERLILETEDFTISQRSEDTMNLPIELDKNTMKLNDLVVCDTEIEENNTSSDTRLVPEPTDTEALCTHNVSVCPNNEDEAGTNRYMPIDRHLAFETRGIEMSLNENEKKKSSGDEAEQERRLCEELKREEQKSQTERDFQKELRRIMEAEKLHQRELELMEKRAQEKLEQEFQLQQELISNLQRRVREERRMREEELKKMTDEEDKRKRAEEKMKMEAERKRMDEETRRKRQEEEERKKEKRSRMEREEKKKEETKNKKLEDEKRQMKEEETRKSKEAIEWIKKEEENQKRGEEKKKKEERKEVDKRKKLEEEITLRKEEDWRKREDERKRGEEGNMGISEDLRVTEDIEERKQKKEEEADDRKTDGEMRKEDKREHGNVDEVKPEERKKEEEVEEKKETRKREIERIVMEEVRKRGENRTVKKELRPIEENEKWKKEEERKTQVEEQRGKKEKMRRQKNGEDNRKSEEEMRLREDEEELKGYNADNTKVEHENKTKNKENKWEEEFRKEEEESQHAYAEKRRNEEEVGGNREEVYLKMNEEMRPKEKKESKKTWVQDRENVLVRATEVNDKRKTNSMTDQMVKAENSSQLEVSTTRTSSNPDPFLCESAFRPTSTEAKPQQHDLDENISQTSTDKTVHCDSQAADPSTISVLLPMCLPEHTEQKRLSWMKDCIPWSKLSLLNRRKQKGAVRSRRRPWRTAEASSLPPLCPDSLLQATGWKSLQEVTTVTLQDLPGCSLSTLTQCTQLLSLSIRRCGLKSLEGIKQLPKLCYIDMQENDISFIDCENMTSLQVLQLGHNKLTSIHGLAGAENLAALDLSHNSITRIAGLESMRRLQRLSVDHNQIISIKGLKDVYTLLHLDCSYNHLTSVEGLENSALLNTLDLSGNSLTELPSLNNQVLLRELHLDDNNISSLQGLAACWLPLLQHLSLAQNRITQLPSMSDSVSLSNLDLRFNCMPELQNVCESLQGCPLLQEVHLTGNPLQQESGWRSSLQKALPGLRVIDDQETDSSSSPPAVPQVSLAAGSFLTFCQAQFQQTRDLQEQHSRELSNAPSSVDAVKMSCRHFTEALQLATDHRFAHEYGDTTVANKHRAPGQKPKLEEVLNMDGTTAEKRTECPVIESNGKVPPVFPNGDDVRSSYWAFDEKSAADSRHDTATIVTTEPTMGPTISTANSSSGLSLAIETKTISSSHEMTTVFNHLDPDLQNTAAVVIQQQWRKYRQKCGNISSPSTAEKGGGRGDGRKPESGPSNINGNVVGQDYAATVIQAFWRGCTLRRRLASALTAVTCLDSGEDDIFEEVDVDEFVFDEAELEKQWTLPLPEDSPPKRYPVSEQPLLLKVKTPGLCLPPPLVKMSKQAWLSEEQVDSAGPRVSPVSSRTKSPASVISGLSDSSEKILEEWGFTNSQTALLMLKRAQKMKSEKKQQNKSHVPSIHLALFRNCSYQLGQVKARNRQMRHNRNHIKVGEAELDLQQAEKTERVKRERAQQHTQTAHSDRDSESVHFLPEISSDILNGGRVQLVAEARYTDRLHHASGLWANSSLASQPCKENNYPRRNSWSHAREKVPSPQRVTSGPRKKERISFRDNPVQLSGGWGGGKKRYKV